MYIVLTVDKPWWILKGGRVAVLELTLRIILCAGICVYAGACMLALRGLFRRARKDSGWTPTVSVIVAARDEETTIGPLLDDLTAQDYPLENLEIIVSNDGSRDRTAAIVREHVAKDDRIRLVDSHVSTKPFRRKKRAINAGIEASSGKIVMTTDADCRVPTTWVRGMVSRLVDGIDLAAGEVVVYGSTIGGHMEALEFAGIQAMSAGFMNARFPITCNGANLAYRRSAFDRVDGFSGFENVVSGDDDLLMQKIADGNPNKVVYVMGGETAVRVKAADSLRAFIHQRARWASKISRYPSVTARVYLAVVFVFLASALLWFFGSIAGLLPFGFLLALLGVKAAADGIVTFTALVPIQRTWLFTLFPLAELLHIPYIIGVSIKGYWGTFEWRGRRTGALEREC